MDNKRFKDYQEFEAFVLSVLRQKAAENEQIILTGNSATEAFRYQYIKYDMNRFYQYDAVAPNGFESIKQPVIFEFKFRPRSNLNSKDVKDAFLRFYSDNYIYIFITNTIVEDKTKIDLDRPNVIVWDKDIVDQWIDNYPIDFNNALSLQVIKSPDIASDVNNEDFELKSKSNILVVKKLIEANENFALVLGAGVSCDLGAKDWNGLLQHFKKHLSKEKIIMSPDEVCKRIGDTVLITAELCKDLYKNEKDFYWDIHNGIYCNHRTPGKLYEIDVIASIISKCKDGRNFRVLTYNYDDFLEKSLDKIGLPYTVIYNQFCTPSVKLPIYHAHGFFPQVNDKKDIQEVYYKSIVLTESNYNELYNHPYDWTISCQLSFFRENTCLFVGSSLSDPNIRRLMQIAKTKDKVHYAIMIKQKMSIKDLTIISNHFLKLGVEIIWVDDYPDIVSVLKSLY